MGGGCLFSDDKIVTFLAVVRETNSFKHLDGRVQRNIDVYNKLADLTNERHSQSSLIAKI